MFFATLNRRTVCFVLVVLTISLTSLGVRIPNHAGLSSSSSKPKPRPRAIIENQIKTCKQVIKDAVTPVAVLDKPPAPVVAAFFIHHLALQSSVSSLLHIVQQHTRAPPLPA